MQPRSEYTGAKPERLSKNGKDLERVKVFYESEAKLREVSLHGLVLPRTCIKRSQQCDIYPLFQILKRLGLIIANLCKLEVTCKLCSLTHHHDYCGSEVKKQKLPKLSPFTFCG